MATVTLRRSDAFPVGTTVGIYPVAAAPIEPTGIARGTALASGTVDAAGLLTVTDAALASLTPYVAHAVVGGVPHSLRVRSTLDIHEAGTVVGTGDTTANSGAILNASASAGSFQVGQRISGAGIRPGTLIRSISGATLTLDQTCSATATGVAIAGEGGLSTQRTRTMRRRAALGTV